MQVDIFVHVATGRDATGVVLTKAFGPEKLKHFEVITDELPVQA
jgi:hypothetical protein